MKGLPENIEELFDRTIEAYEAFNILLHAYQDTDAPLRPTITTVADWNSYVLELDQYNQCEELLGRDLLRSKRKYWGIRDELLPILPNKVSFIYKGYKITKTPLGLEAQNIKIEECDGSTNTG